MRRSASPASRASASMRADGGVGLVVARVLEEELRPSLEVVGGGTQPREGDPLRLALALELPQKAEESLRRLGVAAAAG